MTRGRQRVLRVGLAASVTAVVLTSVAVAHRSSDSVFAGSWQTTRGPMFLRSSSNVIDWGEYGANPIGRVCGVHVFTQDSPPKLVLSGLWYEGGPGYTPSSEIACGNRHSTPWGRFYFTISNDGKSFTGGFTTTGDGLGIGNTSQWPAWNGTKSGTATPPTSTTGAGSPSSAQRFAVTVSGTGTFNSGDARKNVFRSGSATYRMTQPRISLSASVRHNVTVANNPPKLLSGNAVVSVVFRKIQGSGRATFPLRFVYRLGAVDDLDDSAKGQAFAFKGKLTSPKLSICKSFDVYSDQEGMLDFTVCGVGGSGRSKTSIR